MTDDPSTVRLRTTRSRRLANEWALVLEAEGLSPAVWQASEGFVLGVATEQAERASAALSAYDRENVPIAPATDDEPTGSAHLYVALGVSVVLLDFFLVTDVWESALPWFERGSADAARILAGEWWRTVTALTLHSGIIHALANTVAGAIFFTAVFRAVGPGVGSALVLLAGVGGNLVNALFYSAYHVSIGASTAVFGAVGLLGGLGVVRRHRSGLRGRRAWVPLAAGVALLAMLGTAGARTDLFAHLFGFVVGGVAGLIVAFAVPRRPGPRLQWASGTAALALIVYSWLLALG
ncbi:MAG: rhomboid family intramembrane serine protease [Acidiferrobacterales bacterium]